MDNYQITSYSGAEMEALFGKIDDLGNASQSTAGLMSAADKTKLDGLDSGAQANVLEGVKIAGADLPITEKKVNIPADSSPTSGSNSLVRSGGVFNAIKDFITRSVNDLVNYYTKSDTYTKTEVNNIIGSLNQFHYEIYASTSAVTNPQPNVLYLIGPTGTGSDKYEEYVYSNGWVKIGDTTIDLSGYSTTEQMNAAINNALKDYATKEEVNQLGQYITDYNWVRVIVDSNGRILFGVRIDGSVDFFKGVPTSVKTYIDNEISLIKDGTDPDELDGLNKIIAFLDGISTRGTLANMLSEKVDKIEGKTLIDSHHADAAAFAVTDEWVQAITDTYGRILYGVKSDGSFFFGIASDEVKALIRSLSSGGTEFRVPVLDANFDTAIDYEVTGTKGSPTAKYEFNLPLASSWLVRFRFRITENLLNAEKDADIASLNGAKVTAHAIPLSQWTEQKTIDGVDYTEKWPCFGGGIAFNATAINALLHRQNLGKQAFSVRYVGNSSSVTLENNGTSIVLSADGTDTEYILANYNNVSELYAAMLQNSDLELAYGAMDKRTCDELAIFPPIALKEDYHFGGDVVSDAAPLYLRYAVSEEWHQAEMVKIGNKIYSVCDGRMTSVTSSLGDNILTLGGDCGVLFKDLEIHTDGPADAELVNGVIVSNTNPSIIICECHGMYDGPAYSVTPAQTDSGMNSLNPDTMEYFAGILEEKGYVPVTIVDVADFYVAGKPLPKRCYVPIFDDARWPIVLNNAFRAVFNRHGIHPTLALITGNSSPIYHNGSVISEDVASRIVEDAGGWIVSHSRNHRTLNGAKPSEYRDELTEDIYDADLKYADGSILVYPGGNINHYVQEAMDAVGMKLGVEIYRYNSSGNISHNRFMLSRINIGRIITSDGTFIDYSTYTNKFI